MALTQCFCAGLLRESSRRAFGWVLESAKPETCWRAIHTYREVPPLPGSNTPDLPNPRQSFGSPQGRTLLLGIATDEAQTPSERALALNYLFFNLWPQPARRGAQLSPPNAVEHARIIRALVPLLKSKAPTVRENAANALRWVDASDYLNRALKARAALPALQAALQAEAVPSTRQAMAFAISEIQTP